MFKIPLAAIGAFLMSLASAQFPSYPNIDLVARGNDESTSPSISSNGNLVAFYTKSTNLATGASVPSIQVFNVSSGGYEIASPGIAGGVSRPFISRDGLFVVFYGAASVGSSALPCVYNLTTHSLSTISTSTTLVGPDDSVDSPSISDAVGGTRYVAFKELAPTVVKGGTIPPQILVWDQSAGTTKVASQVSGPTKANGTCWFPTISADGTRVAFSSTATNLYSVSTSQNVFYSRLTSGTWAVTDCPSNSMGNGADWPSISGDGLRVTFHSNSGTGVQMAVYLWGTTFSAFQPYPSTAAPAGSAKITHCPSISPDGRYIIFTSDRGLDSALDPVDLYWLGSGWGNVGLVAPAQYTFVCDTNTGSCTLLSYRISTNKKGRVGNWGAISNNADCAAFFTPSDRVYDASYPTVNEIYLRH